MSNAPQVTKRQSIVDELMSGPIQTNENNNENKSQYLDNEEPSLSYSISNTKQLVEVEEKRRETYTLRRLKTEALIHETEQDKLFSSLKSSLSQSACTIIVFGASGHLAKTKTYPALYDLYCEGVFPNNVNIIGYARSKLNKKDFHKKINIKLKGDKVYCIQIEFIPNCNKNS